MRIFCRCLRLHFPGPPCYAENFCTEINIKMSPLFVLQQCIGSAIHVLSKDNSEASGILEGFDGDLNLILRKATITESANHADSSTKPAEKQTVTIQEIPRLLLNGSHVLVIIPGEQG